MLDLAGALGRLRRGRGEGKGAAMADVKVLDVGCGIGGPMRNICKFTGCDVTGLTLNQYQVDRGNELCRSDPHFAVHGSDNEGESRDIVTIQAANAVLNIFVTFRF